MISPEFGKAGFMIGIFVALVSGGLLLVVDRNSAEFTISLLTFGIGVLFIIVIALLVRIGTRKG
jgi:uncharacterized membrane protein